MATLQLGESSRSLLLIQQHSSFLLIGVKYSRKEAMAIDMNFHLNIRLILSVRNGSVGFCF